MKKPANPDPYYPNLPLIPDETWERMSKEERWQRHLLEVAEGQRMFDAMQDPGVDIFDASQRIPTPRMDRAGMESGAHLQQLVMEYGSWDRIPPEAWKRTTTPSSKCRSNGSGGLGVRSRRTARRWRPQRVLCDTARQASRSSRRSPHCLAVRDRVGDEPA
jgi:hypothetical protein